MINNVFSVLFYKLGAGQYLFGVCPGAFHTLNKTQKTNKTKQQKTIYTMNE